MFRNREKNKVYEVISNFNQITEKKCIKLDTNNERVYATLLSKAQKAHKTLENCILNINIEVPPPPKPSNRDRLILWKKRNVSMPVIEQSKAILYLYSNNFELDKDYEAYQAIDLYHELKKQKGVFEQEEDKSTNFDNVYSAADSNIYRRRSIIRMETPCNIQKNIQRETSKNMCQDALGYPANQVTNYINNNHKTNDIDPSIRNINNKNNFLP